MGKVCDPNIFLLAISKYEDGSLFSIYATVLGRILQEEENKPPREREEIEKIILPSDKDWRSQKYFLLVDLQKEYIAADENVPESLRPEVSEEWAPWNIVMPTKNPHAPPPVKIITSPGPAWDIVKVLKAAQLLHKRDVSSVEFEDEQEMRCVYAVIYDVFRYKTILEQALDDIDFFGNYPEFSVHKHVVWLFVMELARRRWMGRARNEMYRARELMVEYGSPFLEIEKTVWGQRVHFAAAIARIRIKNQVFTLSELLPNHLKDEKSSACVNKDTVTGWVNTFKTKKVAALVKRLNQLGFSYSSSKQLCSGEYRFDRVCPRFITLRPPENTSVGQIDLIRNGVIVLQEREFCEGASTLCRALRANDLRGTVAQTHPSSPRCSAYLAAQLRELATVLKAKSPPAPLTPELGKLVVFGAGDKVESYVCALRELGIEASSEVPQNDAAVVYVIRDAVYCDTPTVSNALEDVVAVLAVPPNSYSAVSDPIDLVCGRGGDIEMLEILTETEITNKAETRVRSILEEQNKTLMTLLSKPQIQLILYETHSALPAENQLQVKRAVVEANKMATEKHGLSIKKSKTQPTEITNYPSPKHEPMTAESTARDPVRQVSVKEDIEAERSDESMSPLPSPTKKNVQHETVLTKSQKQEKQSRPETSKSRPIPEPPTRDSTAVEITQIKVPNCDLFEVHKLPTIGNGLDINYILDRDGCYLGLIQRKEITRLNAKYMIDVAEERGLFGSTAAPPPSAKVKKKDTSHTSHVHRKKRRKSFEVERVSAPTYASLSRSQRRGSAPAGGGVFDMPASQDRICPRHMRQQAAASAYTGGCTCDAKHRQPYAKAGQAQSGVPGPPCLGSGAPASPRITSACRKPFPLAVTDVTLSTARYY